MTFCWGGQSDFEDVISNNQTGELDNINAIRYQTYRMFVMKITYYRV